MSRLLLAVVSLLLSGAITAAAAGDRITGAAFATRSEVIAQNGLVATSHPLATQVGLDVLKAGGTAVDAAIAANAALGLMEPTGNGVGGDLFAIVWDAKTKKLYGYNGSGRSPRGLTLEWFLQNGYSEIPPYGPLPVSVPGTVDGWFALHDRFGKAQGCRGKAVCVGHRCAVMVGPGHASSLPVNGFQRPSPRLRLGSHRRRCYSSTVPLILLGHTGNLQRMHRRSLFRCMSCCSGTFAGHDRVE